YRERLELFQYRKKVKFSLFYFPNIQSCFLSLHLPETLIVIASLTKVRRGNPLKQGSASRKA
ncbi:MAG: hypothetical protein J6W29_02020, partial [Neisseriaceae bacterium]|nr:hypothetical protein [Neisseriaceae bacterium]